MRGFYFLPLMLQMGCVIEQPIKIYLRIVDSGITEVVGGGNLDGGDEPIDDPNQNGEPTNEPSGDPNGGDPNGGDPVGEPGGDPEPSGEVSGEPGSDPGGGGGDPGVFDSCDAAVYCLLAGEDASSFNNYFNEQQSCTSASSDSTYDDWFTCVIADKGSPCSGAGGGDWSGCDCAAVQSCSDNNADPFNE